VEAIEDCEVFRIDREDFERQREAQRPVAYKIILSLAATVDARRRQAESRIQEVFEDPAQHIDVFQGQVHELLARLRKV
jgi:CRP-like cAMP-binding protein